VHFNLSFTITIYKGAQNKNSNERAPYISETLKSKISELGNFNIYSDIVEYQYVENEQALLLRIVLTGDVVKEMTSTTKYLIHLIIYLWQGIILILFRSLLEIV
jgi:hypothetical protein